MKLTGHFYHPFFCFFLLSSLLTGFSLQAEARFNETQTYPQKDTTCLKGWFAVPDTDNSTCLQVTGCFLNETGLSASNKRQLPILEIQTCPEGLYQAADPDPGIVALVEHHSGSTTHSEYISVPSEAVSSEWTYGWSGANLGMAGLHIAKAFSKSKLLSNGKNINHNAIFFTTYMVGAIHHILEMPGVISTQLLPKMAHYFIHSGMVLLSIAERLFDCSCCSQYKNGHNTMIAFHIIALALAMAW